MFGRAIAEKALADLKAARAANSGKLPLDMWLNRLGKSIEEGFEEYFEVEPQARIPRKGYNELFNCLAVVCGMDLSRMTYKAKREVAVALAEIRKASPTLTREELEACASKYRSKWPTRELTPSALAKWWANVGAPKAERSIYDQPPDGWREELVRLAGNEYANASWESVRVVYGRRIIQSLG